MVIDEGAKKTDEIAGGSGPSSLQRFQVVALDGPEQRRRAHGGRMAIGSGA